MMESWKLSIFFSFLRYIPQVQKFPSRGGEWTLAAVSWQIVFTLSIFGSVCQNFVSDSAYTYTVGLATWLPASACLCTHPLSSTLGVYKDEFCLHFCASVTLAWSLGTPLHPIQYGSARCQGKTYILHLPKNQTDYPMPVGMADQAPSQSFQINNQCVLSNPNILRALDTPLPHTSPHLGPHLIWVPSNSEEDFDPDHSSQLGWAGHTTKLWTQAGIWVPGAEGKKKMSQDRQNWTEC